jgi:lipopolysaccharide transport system ATP-binding protein
LPAITVEHLSKEYVIGERFGQADTLRERVSSFFRPSSQYGQAPGKPRQERFWALKDVSFDVAPGEVVGIIGRNGAGKSTLLKILSRITEPTTGQAELYGRVSSLLEVGTGFHPELSGRENVYLNGAILGMARAEIRKKFDEIVAFAEMERFLDTPVKHYSSGMYMRLAFAVAAHLDSEILVIDEVLAVGDLSFQKKCLGKMDEIRHQGRTLLIVSHNMTTILGLCTKCLLLDDGKLKSEGAPAEMIRAYRNDSGGEDGLAGRTDLSGVVRYGAGTARFLSVSVTPRDERGVALPFAVTGCDLEIVLGIRALADLEEATVAVTLYDELGIRIVDANSLIKGMSLSLRGSERGEARFLLRNVRLKPDTYVVGLWLGVINGGDIDGVLHATSFRMEPRREDVLYTAPFPGAYACEFLCDLRVPAESRNS